jgi:hypothetical protein
VIGGRREVGVRLEAEPSGVIDGTRCRAWSIDVSCGVPSGSMAEKNIRRNVGRSRSFITSGPRAFFTPRQ